MIRLFIRIYWSMWRLFTWLCVASICVEATLTPREDASTDLTRLPSFEYKPRIFILSDILNEVDDSESLVRYLLYSNEFDTQGICAVTSEWLPNITHPQAMKDIINAYGEVVENLNNHVNPKARYSNASDLIDLVTSGPTVYGRQAFSQPLSDGASKLLDRLQASTDPLWVVAWGGVNTLAQVLQHMQDTYPGPVATDLRSRLRVYTISDQDDTGPWIRATFPDIFYIVSIHAWNAYATATWTGISGALPGADATTVSDAWLAAHIQRGPLGARYPTPEYTMEGDTPSFLYLVQNGLGHPEHPHWGGWGGRYGYHHPGSRHYHDVVDQVVGAAGAAGATTNYTTSQASIWRWRDHFQNDFAARMGWTLTPAFARASHPPVPVVNGTQGPQFLNLTVRPGDSFVLDAGRSYDPDHPDTLDHLAFRWYQYAEPTAYATNARTIPRVTLGALLSSPPTSSSNSTLSSIDDAGFQDVVLGTEVRVTIPEDETGLAYHVILQVSNEAHLRRYVRVVINV